MELSEAIQSVTSHREYAELHDAERFLTERLNTTSDVEAKASAAYYLLRLKLKKHTLYETTEQIALYHKLHRLLLDLEKQYLHTFRSHKKTGLDREQLRAFYNLALYYYGSLETAYAGLNYDESMRNAYKDKMCLKRRFFAMQGHTLKALGYRIVEITSQYGNSFLRWGMTSLVMVLFFATIYAFTDSALLPVQRLVQAGMPLYNYLYYSVVTFTTLGYGDITPIIGFHKLLASIEVICGYFMLGMFINLMNRKL